MAWVACSIWWIATPVRADVLAAAVLAGDQRSGLIRIGVNGTATQFFSFGTQAEIDSAPSAIVDLASGIAYDPTRRRVYVAVQNGIDHDRDRIVALDLDSATIVAQSPPGLAALRGVTDIAIVPTDGSLLATAPARIVTVASDLTEATVLTSHQYLSIPAAVAVSLDGRHAFVADGPHWINGADLSNKAIVEVDLATGGQRLIAKEDLLAPTYYSSVHLPADVAVGSDGSLIVPDGLALLRIDAESGAVGPIFAYDPASQSALFTAVAVDAGGRIFAAEGATRPRILSLDSDGQATTLADGDGVFLPLSLAVIDGGPPSGRMCNSVPTCSDRLDALIVLPDLSERFPGRRQAQKLSIALTHWRTALARVAQSTGRSRARAERRARTLMPKLRHAIERGVKTGWLHADLPSVFATLDQTTGLLAGAA